MTDIRFEHQKESSTHENRHWYEKFEEKLEANLAERINNAPIEVPSNPKDFQDLVTQVKGSIKKEWVMSMLDLYDKGDFKLNLEKHNGTVASFLDSREAFEKVLSSNNLMPLYEVRLHGEPEMCRAGILALSQLNLATFDVLEKWVKKREEDDPLFKQIDLPKNVFELYLDINKHTQSPVDKIRVAEQELGDTPEGADYSSYHNMDGSQHVYFKRVENTDTYEAIPLINIEGQTEHRKKLAFNLIGLAARIKNDISESRLPSNCIGLDTYLQNLAEQFLSTEVGLESLEERWSALEKQCTQLALGGCPILIFPPSFVGDGGRVETDLLIGINTTLNSKHTDFNKAISQSAIEIAKRHGIPEDEVPFISTIIMFANGTSHQWIAGGYAMESAVLIVDNEVENVIKRLYNSPLAEMFADLSSYEKLLIARTISLKAHETGHWPQNSQEVKDRLGAVLAYNKLEEARADHKGALELLNLIQKGYPIDLKSYVESYLFENVEFLISGYDNMEEDTSSTWYSFSACTMITKLFEVGTIKWEGEKIVVVEDKLLAGLTAMAKIGEDIINLFKDESTTPEIAEEYVNELYKKSLESEDFQKYMDKIRELYK